MLTALGTGVRFRLAIALAGFAALCFTLPPAVLAMGHGDQTMNCLSHADEVNHGSAKAPEPDGGSMHPAGHETPAGDHQMSCCGLFCLSADVAGEAGVPIRPVCGMPHIMGPAPRLLSGVPELPERPPNTVLSV